MNRRRALLSRVLAGPFIVLLCMAPRAWAQQRVLKLVEVQKNPPCSTWSDITSCAPNGGAITWQGSYNTTYTWTVPPETIGPDGTPISLSVSQSNPYERKVATGLRMTGSGFVFDPPNPDIPVGAGDQPLSGNVNVNVKPPANPSGDYYLEIGVYWGPGFVYHYRAELSSDPSPKPDPSDRPPAFTRGELRAVAVWGDVWYRKGGSLALLPVERDTVLKVGDHVTTGPDGSVTLAFADNSTTVLKGATDLNIAEYFTEGGAMKVEMRLENGEALWKVRKAFLDEIRKSDFNIKTPTDVSSVRGTVFTTRYDPRTQTSTTTVEEGVVEVTPVNTSLAPVTLRAGQQVKVTPNRMWNVTSTAKGPGGASGRWSGPWINDRGESGQSTINLTEQGGAITGDEGGWRIENGRRSGAVLTWEYRNQNNGCRDYTVRFEISADGSTANGTYAVIDRCEETTYNGQYLDYRR